MNSGREWRYVWIQAAEKTEVAVNGAEIGNRMPDRTVYAGLSPDTHKARSAISGPNRS